MYRRIIKTMSSQRFVLSHLLKALNGRNTISKRQLSCTAGVLQKKLNVCIEGNIGSGKTTFLRQFKGYESFVEVIDEPVKHWRDFGGENPLACMYDDPKRWAFTFQNLVFVTLLRQHTNTKTKPLRVMERSLLSARYCFSENLKHRGYLSAIESTILSQWFEYVIQQYHVNVDLIVYLQTSPETCIQRIKARNRPEEQIVTMDYLRDLHQLHENWLIHRTNPAFITPPVMVIDGNHDMNTMKDKFSNYRSQILSKLQEDNVSQRSPG